MFEELLKENISLEIKQEKWFQSLINSNITISETPYNLKVTSNKRNSVYENGLLVATSNKKLEL